MARSLGWHRVVGALLCGVVGCDEGPAIATTEPIKPGLVTPVFSEYPDSAAMIAAGIPFSGSINVTSTGQLLADTAFRGTGTVDFYWANDVSFSMSARLINANGTTINNDSKSAAWYRIDFPVYHGDTSLSVTLATNGNKCGLTGKTNATGTARTILNPGGLVVWQLTQPESAPDKQQPACRVPAPKFSMSSSSQTSGSGGTLTISDGHSITLTSTTTDFGVPAAQAGDLTWAFDQTQIGTGSSKTYTPPYGSHSITLSLTNSTGQGEASATVVVVPSDEAGSCDDELTDVVETNCDEQGSPGGYGVGGSSSSGTRNCWVLDWYVWNEGLGHYVFDHSDEISCWYET